MFGFIGYPRGLRIGEFSFLALKDLEQVHSRRPAHLLEPLDWHDGGKGLTFTLDDELVIAERHPIQDIPEPLPHFQCRNCLYHVALMNRTHFHNDDSCSSPPSQTEGALVVVVTDLAGHSKVPGEDLELAQRLARRKGIPKYQTYIKTLLHDMLVKEAENER